MQRHHRRVVAGTDLDAAGRQEAPRIAPRQRQLAQPLRRHEREDGEGEAHRWSVTKPALKPGPSAESSERPPRSRSFTARSSTNSTVGDDMLP